MDVGLCVKHLFLSCDSDYGWDMMTAVSKTLQYEA